MLGYRVVAVARCVVPRACDSGLFPCFLWVMRFQGLQERRHDVMFILFIQRQRCRDGCTGRLGCLCGRDPATFGERTVFDALCLL
jgi:hypothetical protein